MPKLRRGVRARIMRCNPKQQKKVTTKRPRATGALGYNKLLTHVGEAQACPCRDNRQSGRLCRICRFLLTTHGPREYVSRGRKRTIIVRLAAGWACHSRRKKRIGCVSLAHLKGPGGPFVSRSGGWQCAGTGTVVLALAPKQESHFPKATG